MSTWGSFFTSYAKKKPSTENAESAPKIDAIPENPPKRKVHISALDASVPAAATAAARPSPASKLTDGFQRANLSAKKLYEIPKEPVIKDLSDGQKVNSNASRVAKMFGYAASVYTPPNAESKPGLPVSSAVTTVEAVTPKKSDTKLERPFTPLVAMVKPATSNTPEPKVMPIVDAVLKYKKENATTSAKPKTKKDEVQEMLDFFASQVDEPNDGLALPGDKKRNGAAPAEEKVATMPGGRGKPKAMDMLEFFSSQLDSASDTLALPGDKNTETPKPVAKPKSKAIDMLDMLSSQLDSADDIFALPSNKKSEAPKSAVRQQPQRPAVQTSIPPLTGENSGRSSRGSNTAQDQKMTMASPKRKIWSRKNSRTSSELNATIRKRKDSVWSQQESPTSSERAISIKKRTSQIEQDVVKIRGRINSFEENEKQLKLERERRDAEHERIVELQNQAQQIIVEREQMEREKDRMLQEQLQFEKEARRIAEEAESMRIFVENVERERQLDIENQEKKRIRREAEERAKREAEEEERRRIEAEELAERIRLEEVEKSIREAELAAELEAERAVREIEKEERKRVEDLERKKAYGAREDLLAKEEADRLTAKMREYEEEEEAARRFQAKEEDRKRDIARQRALEYEESQDRKREVERRRRLAEKERQELDERQRYENSTTEEARYLERERINELQRREAEKRADQLFQRAKERQMYSQERAGFRYPQERTDRNRAAGADRLADAYRLDLASKPMPSPSVYEDEIYESEEEEEREETKEEKLAKAEGKIRMAFAGLAEERGQQAPAVAPLSPLPRANTVRDNRGPGGYGGFGAQQPTSRQESVVSRYNTTGGGGGARLQTREAPQIALVKVNNSVNGRRVGLPSGPRAGGLPSGPRPTRR